MEHQTNIGYIHTHTKSRGGHHDSFLPTDELELLLCTFVLVHVGMAFGNAGELILQVIGDYVYIPTGRTVYNDTSVLTIFPDVVPHTLQPLMLIYIKTRTVLFQQGDIFTAKAHRVNVRMLHAEKFLDVLLVIMRCSGRKGCYDRTALELGDLMLDLQIIGPKGISPHCDTVGFINHHQPGIVCLHHFAQTTCLQLFGCGVEQGDLAVPYLLEDFVMIRAVASCD